MYNTYFWLFLLAHIIGDFYTQTNNIAEKKKTIIKWVLIHSILYLLTCLIVLLPVMSSFVLLQVIVFSSFHGLVDIIKFIYINKVSRKPRSDFFDCKVFMIDQGIHFISIIGIAILTLQNNPRPYFATILVKLTSAVDVNSLSLLRWMVLLLLIHKPANIMIMKFLKQYKPEDNRTERRRDKNAGRFIGTLERFIILLFISIGQYAAIGLVLTAKSIARYERITKEKDFAEYYLLGTLISTAFVLVISKLI